MGAVVSHRSKPVQAAALWALMGVAITLLEAIARLGARALATLGSGLSLVEWLSFLGLTIALTYTEGYRAFQCRFVPRVVRRAMEANVRRPVYIALAPLYALSLIGDDRRSVGRAWLAVMLIVAAVFLVRALPAPWRGIVDGAVAVALSWGLVALLAQALAAFRGRSVAPD